jgi:alpha-D-xyloside xylohydrolase
MPVFVRAGSIVPMGPDVEYATEKPADPIELRVYRGADASFTIYEDENDNYNYEKGGRATIRVDWNDGAGKLTIGARQGSFPGMLASRTFRIVFVSGNHGTGIEPVTQADKVVTYTGEVVVIAR